MNAKKRKSKKRSAASSKQQPKDFVYYLDRSLGKHIIADTLRSFNIRVEVHDDHLPINAPDEKWISFVGKQNWLAITKDRNIRYRYAEIEAIKSHKARVIVVRTKNATGQEIAELLTKFNNRIQKFANKTVPPFVAGLDRSGSLTQYSIKTKE